MLWRLYLQDRKNFNCILYNSILKVQGGNARSCTCSAFKNISYLSLKKKQQKKTHPAPILNRFLKIPS